MKDKKALELKVTIPAPAVPLLKALSELSETSVEVMASRAIVLWLKSEDAMCLIDDEVNSLLRADD